MRHKSCGIFANARRQEGLTCLSPSLQWVVDNKNVLSVLSFERWRSRCVPRMEHSLMGRVGAAPQDPTVDQKHACVIARPIFLIGVAFHHDITGIARTRHVLYGDVPWASCDSAAAVRRGYCVPHAMLCSSNTTASALLELRHQFC